MDLSHPPTHESNINCERLEIPFQLADCINIADEAVGAVAQLLPSLYEFSLQVGMRGQQTPPGNQLLIRAGISFSPSSIFQAYHVTDAALGYFSPKQSHSLSILRLQSCWELTNHGIVNIGKSLIRLLFVL